MAENFAAQVALTGIDPGADADSARPAIASHEVVRMTPAATPLDLRAYYDDFVESLGTPVDIAEDYATGGAPTGERWSEIRYDADVPDMAAFRHSKNAQPLHTDESYVSSPAGVMLFYCVHAAPTGGETYYVSGRELVAYLETAEPSLLDELLERKVRYAKAADFKYRPIVAIDESAGVDLNFNYFCADPNQDRNAIDLNQRFFDFLQERLPPELVYAVDLQPGESVAWRDDRVLHGRRSFTASKTGDRLIWKTGVVLTA